MRAPRTRRPPTSASSAASSSSIAGESTGIGSTGNGGANSTTFFAELFAPLVSPPPATVTTFTTGDGASGAMLTVKVITG